MPILINLGPIQIRSYGVFLVLAFLAGTFILWREGQKQGYNEEKLLDLSVTTIIFGFLGARVYQVITNWSDYADRFSSVFKVWEGGLSLHGALIGGFVGLWWFTKKNKWPLLQVADFGVLALSLGIIIGKIGSFLNGDDYGVVSNLPFAVHIPGIIGRRHPSPIYELILMFFIYLYLLRYYRAKSKSGGVFYIFLLLSGLARIFTELFRDNRTLILNMKEGFWGGAVLAIIGLLGLYWFYKSTVLGAQELKSVLGKSEVIRDIARDFGNLLDTRKSDVGKKSKRWLSRFGKTLSNLRRKYGNRKD
ncbi:MAG: prolipoprotein diacylglyceryl transferase [Candidatus Woykebacteria bacterium RIFCSPHIGHO2_12_FULL_43_10]|uniref:Phosphatidylglycerol--prolipoprotein diacylglyceryl transferase n=2 Tax=Candidatus Woykeibacteriota TaxID=1817899 RepID=A0A1G1WWP8_9BACT|nr:MAG: prolipoprotein diacylglyceryl transferase [Candidatus Woykebacteria bacterium RIFCSPHIGHO2_01_FULL_43_29]OGY29187.1 MAG: prolipoprotein diacylglyceryl transferase [Candidatus Woykebacteria bacterium RIFCSPHIGHO2_12_FULL_43_10]OGY30000.1 MAG: prolipoprotein diacylglyceryl transferase [Candidatus Woykebacteria bacterium RIFCSPHIGHO2_02_FULL_43_16b]OGY32011.1 MAG: prolipoprotein diacylglyceryl transferase [Candidatus Woykebacteria bacterium RIFCSPLOWO2_01_FULL_43_14]